MITSIKNFPIKIITLRQPISTVPPIDCPGRHNEEDGVDKHDHHAGQVQVDPHSLVLQKTLLLPHPRLDEVEGAEDGEVVGEDDEDGEEEAGSPADQGVEEELGQGRAPPRYLGLEEGPAEVEAHDGHPAEHGEGEEVSGVS